MAAHAARSLNAIEARFRPLQIVRDERAGGSFVLRAVEALRPYPAAMHEHLFRWVTEAPERMFLAERRPGQDGWASITYGEAGEKVLALAAAIADRGLSAERPIVILSGNTIDHQLLTLAGYVAGVPTAPISVAYSLVSQDHGKLKGIIDLLDPGMIYAANGAVFEKPLMLDAMRGREIVVGTPCPALPNATPFSALLKGGSASALDAARATVGADTIAKFLFTSGSTGTPKGVITTHRMLTSNAEMSPQAWPFLDRPQVFVDWLPWSHVFGGNHNMGQILRGGGTLYIDDGKPMPAEFPKTLRNLAEVSPTAYFNVPRAYDLLAHALKSDEALRKRFFAELDVIFYAAASLPEHLWTTLGALAESESDTPASMLTAWGLTETSPTITVLHRHGGESGNIGIPLPGVELKLVPNGPKLEARAKGPNITPGYWRNEKATASAFDEDGFFRTGDALTLVEPKDPGRGVRFNGRVTEDFKLTTGTWVHTGGVRARALAALGPLISDVIVTAPDRDDLGLFIFPSLAAKRDETYAPAVLTALRTMNEGFSGSSERIARAMIMEEPPSLDRGEMTDKGSLNMHAVLEHRDDLLARLYAGNHPDVLRP
ncbi:long-chain-fatty-acid--CoA ligase [Variibacter gotjawalensis]|uniref:Long-chain-fatty-acid--CoA ligase n=1 Tax=Variibacter gotjawalensis TaxID=1333996 RepID=A0A0S3PUM4_9BRAD|nr:feruloyl-CoA synthase [Variibacter gotjawalensis]NIK49950.1 feruloyl-CoA synthase [Variibacter gotjawalensis]RZS45949.1 trans-feruloyl-CoA synthase [Variibacter gotjawalensis]BAT59624.1 long-chain-fatty-acid--CoA ligase [Variibacter gotjawalensis]